MRRKLSLLLDTIALGLLGLIGGALTQAFTQAEHVSTTFEGLEITRRAGKSRCPS